MYIERTIQTTNRGNLVELTDEVKMIVAESGIRHGVAVVSTPESGAGILCTSFYDPKGHEDIIEDFNRIWPARLDFQSTGDPWEIAADSKASVAGQSMDLIVEDAALKLGGSQGIFLAEYGTGQKRIYAVTVLGVQ